MRRTNQCSSCSAKFFWYRPSGEGGGATALPPFYSPDGAPVAAVAVGSADHALAHALHAYRGLNLHPQTPARFGKRSNVALEIELKPNERILLRDAL
jgi:hypothetical protein